MLLQYRWRTEKLTFGDEFASEPIRQSGITLLSTAQSLVRIYVKQVGWLILDLRAPVAGNANSSIYPVSIKGFPVVRYHNYSRRKTMQLKS